MMPWSVDFERDQAQARSLPEPAPLSNWVPKADELFRCSVCHGFHRMTDMCGIPLAMLGTHTQPVLAPPGSAGEKAAASVRKPSMVMYGFTAGGHDWQGERCAACGMSVLRFSLRGGEAKCRPVGARMPIADVFDGATAPQITSRSLTPPNRSPLLGAAPWGAE